MKLMLPEVGNIKRVGEDLQQSNVLSLFSVFIAQGSLRFGAGRASALTGFQTPFFFL
jgi:hypothetical protein